MAGHTIGRNLLSTHLLMRKKHFIAMNPNAEIQRLQAEIQRLQAENQQLRASLMQCNAATPAPTTSPSMFTPPSTTAAPQSSFFGQLGSAISKGVDKYGATAAQAAAQAALAAQSAPRGQRSGAAFRGALLSQQQPQ